eukprot:420910-Pyramimonas_sp.AAC.1
MGTPGKPRGPRTYRMSQDIPRTPGTHLRTLLVPRTPLPHVKTTTRSITTTARTRRRIDWRCS